MGITPSIKYPQIESAIGSIESIEIKQILWLLLAKCNKIFTPDSPYRQKQSFDYSKWYFSSNNLTKLKRVIM